MPTASLPTWYTDTPAGRELAAQADAAVRDQRAAAIAELCTADEAHAEAVAPLREARPKAAKRLADARRELQWAESAMTALDRELANADARRDRSHDRANRTLDSTLPGEVHEARRVLHLAFQHACSEIPVTYHSPARNAPHGPLPPVVRSYDVNFAEQRVAEVRAAGDRLTRVCVTEPDPAVVRELANDIIQTFGGAK